VAPPSRPKHPYRPHFLIPTILLRGKGSIGSFREHNMLAIAHVLFTQVFLWSQDGGIYLKQENEVKNSYTIQ
jgi:hypothetical protein